MGHMREIKMGMEEGLLNPPSPSPLLFLFLFHIFKMKLTLKLIKKILKYIS
jgi:hypothetical protein